MPDKLDKIVKLSKELALPNKGLYKLKPDVNVSDYDLIVQNREGKTYLIDSSLIESNGIESIVEGDNITIDNTDPLNPIISATGGGSTNIYNSDGTLTSFRLVTGGGNELGFTDISNFQVYTDIQLVLSSTNNTTNETSIRIFGKNDNGATGVDITGESNVGSSMSALNLIGNNSDLIDGIDIAIAPLNGRLKIDYLPLDTPTEILGLKAGLACLIDINDVLIYHESNHADLLAAKQAGLLKKGHKYFLNDFATVYDQPDYDVAGVAKVAVTVKTGSIERLVLTAISDSEFAEEVQSLDFPNDKIKYDIDWIETRLMLAPAKGLITERIDEFNNRTDHDHRTVVYKRYLEAVPLGEVEIAGLNVTSFTSQTDFTSLVSGDAIKIGTDDFVVDVVTDFQNMTVVSNVGVIAGTQLLSKYGYTSYKDNGAASIELPMFDLTQCLDNQVDNYRHYAPLLGSSFDLPNSVITSICLNNIMREVFANNTIDGCTSNTFGQTFIGNKVIFGLSYNYFGSACANNIILSMVQNSIWGTLKNSNIGSSFDNNIQYDVTDNLTTGSFCKEGVYYGFTNNVTLGHNNKKLKFWDAEDLLIENNNTSVDFAGTKNITAPNVMSNIKNAVFTGVDGAAWVNYVSPASHPELYTHTKKTIDLASDGNVYMIYFNGITFVTSLID